MWWCSEDSNWTLNAVLVKKSTMLNKKVLWGREREGGVVVQGRHFVMTNAACDGDNSV